MFCREEVSRARESIEEEGEGEYRGRESIKAIDGKTNMISQRGASGEIFSGL